MKTKEELLQAKRDWYRKNIEKCKLSSKKFRESHKEQRKIDHDNWVEKNKERVKEYHHKYNTSWYLKNKGAVDEKNKLYSKTHRKEMVKNVQKYVSNNKEKVKEYQKGFEQSVSGKFRQLMWRAKHFSGTPITLDRFAVLITQPCIYCGDNGKVGIDRVDNSQGYTLENSASCCKICNFMKKTTTKGEFLKQIEKIYLYNNEQRN